MIVVKLTIEVPKIWAELLATLDEELSAESALLRLADNAQQGVYRPMSWQRNWIVSVFGDEWITQRMITGDPYKRGLDAVFQRPKTLSEELDL